MVQPFKPRNRSQSDVINLRSPSPGQDRYQSNRRDILPPTPPSEPDALIQKRSRSQPPQRSQSLSARSSGSSYSTRRRALPSIEDDNEDEEQIQGRVNGEELRRSRSFSGRKTAPRRRATTKTERNRDDYYGNVYDDYIDEPKGNVTFDRADVFKHSGRLQRAPSKNLSRSRSRRNLVRDEESGSDFGGEEEALMTEIACSLYVNGSNIAKELVIEIDGELSLQDFLAQVTDRLNVQGVECVFKKGDGQLSELSHQQDIKSFVLHAKNAAEKAGASFGKADVLSVAKRANSLGSGYRSGDQITLSLI
jgi:hypothetical protein